MKKVVYTVTIAVALIATSCSSSKKTAEAISEPTSSSGYEKVEDNKCELLALEKIDGVYRGYGMGESQNKNFARNMASNNARNEIASSISTKLKGAIDDYMQQYGASGQQQIVRDEKQKVEQIISSNVNEKLGNSTIVCSENFIKDGTYQVHVCIECKPDLDDIAKSVVENLTKDMKLKIDYDADKFKKYKGI